MSTEPDLIFDDGEPDREQITAILQRWSTGETNALRQLIPKIYQDLRVLAKRSLAGESGNQTFSPTVLINEVYLGLEKQEKFHFENRKRFLAFAGVMMRHILIKHARYHQRGKRGGQAPKITLEEGLYNPGDFSLDQDRLLALDDALTRLEKTDSKLCRIVELRFFSGFTHQQIADLMGISVRTVQREWEIAKCWLRRELRS